MGGRALASAPSPAVSYDATSRSPLESPLPQEPPLGFPGGEAGHEGMGVYIGVSTGAPWATTASAMHLPSWDRTTLPTWHLLAHCTMEKSSRCLLRHFPGSCSCECSQDPGQSLPSGQDLAGTPPSSPIPKLSSAASQGTASRGRLELKFSNLGGSSHYTVPCHPSCPFLLSLPSATAHFVITHGELSCFTFKCTESIL